MVRVNIVNVLSESKLNSCALMLAYIFAEWLG